jgi:hypothetical protein
MLVYTYGMGDSFYKPKRPRYKAPTALVFTTATAVDRGRVGSTLSKQAEAGRLVRVGQGIYARSDAEMPSWLDALLVAAKASEAVFSGATALHLHGLLRWVPPAVSISQTRGTARPTAPFVPVHVRWMEQSDLKTDTLPLQRDQFCLLVSSPGRAVAELFADRFGVGLAVCSRVVSDLAAAGELDTPEVLRHAERLRCLTEMRALLGSVCG